MKKREDERFCELAHKVIAKRAGPAELAELRAMLEDPRLRREFEDMRAEVALVKEVLPLIEDVEHREATVPPVPLQRLREEVRVVLAQRRAGNDSLRGLLSELRELLSGTRSKAASDRGVGLLAVLEEILLGGRGAFEMEEASLHDAPASAIRGPGERIEREQRRKAEAELRKRLSAMEERLTGALQHLANCNDEARMLLEFVREERMALERRLQQESEAPGDRPG